LSDLQRREFHEALLDADSLEDLPGKWQAAILNAEQNRAQSTDRRERLVRELIDGAENRIADGPS
jgi:hypothetical protein